MHVVVAAFGLAMVIVSSYVLKRLLVGLSARRRQRSLRLLALAAPTLMLGMLLSSFCWEMMPAWDWHLWDEHSLIHLLGLSVVAVATAATIIWLLRNVVATIMVRRYPLATDPILVSAAGRVANQLGVRCPPVRFCDSARPVVVLCGVGGMGGHTVLVSSWAVSNLDEAEKEAILAHELAHLRRRDGLTVGIAHLLRDVAFYVPGLRQICRALEADIELSCDEMAGQATGQRLALASALCKVGRQTLHERGAPLKTLGIGALGGASGVSDLQRRVPALLEEGPASDMEAMQSGTWSRTPVLAALVMLQGLAVIGSFQLLRCGDVYQELIKVAMLALSGLFLAIVFLRLKHA